jgi:hypothetical protein
MSLFGRKTRVPRDKNDIVRSCFCAFWRSKGAQAAHRQELAEGETTRKKSCLKTYGRFFVFGEVCHTRAMNTETTSFSGNENIDSAEETETSGPVLPGSHGRTGKIARLPQAVRQELNRRLRDGLPGGKLLAWLNGLPEVQAVMAAEFQGHPIHKQNLSHWRMGGYQDSLEQEQRQHEVQSLMEEIKGLKDVSKDGLTDQLAFYLAVLAALELRRLKSAPDGIEKAKLWREVRASLLGLRRGDLDLARLQLQREKYGLRHKTQQDREDEFWKWAEENINRNEFCRRRCFTAEEREAAIDKILGITPQERGEIAPQDAPVPTVENGGGNPDQIPPIPT